MSPPFSDSPPPDAGSAQADVVESVSPERIRAESLRNLLSYWQTKSAHLGRLPARADLQPDEMLPFLPFVALITVQNQDPRFQFRLVGTGIVGAFGRETTSRAVDEKLFGDNASEVERFFSIPVQTRGPAYATGKYTVAPTGRGLPFETLLVPLSSNGQAIDMLLGGLVGDRIHRDEQISRFRYDYYCPIGQTAAPQRPPPA